MKRKSEAKKFVSPDGVEIFYWMTWDRGMSGDFQVLHPGAAMNHSSLERLERGLNDRGYPTVVFDPRGAGYSDHPVEREFFQLDRLTADLEGVVAQEGLEEPAILTHSFGFMPAVDYAVKSGNVRQMTGICGSHNFSETAPSKLLYNLFDKVLVRSEYLGSLGMSLTHALKGTDRPECCDQSNPSSEFDLWLSIVDIPLKAAKSHVKGQRECNTWDITERLGQLETPMLLIYGSNDVMVLPIAGRYIQERTTARCSVEVVEGATHSLPIRKPEAVLDITDRYATR